jgi:hypothetical protein
MHNDEIFLFKRLFSFSFLKKILIPLLALTGAGLAQVDTSILKPGRTWVYAHEAMYGLNAFEQPFIGTSEFKIDAVLKHGGDTVEYQVSRKDSGIYRGTGPVTVNRSNRSHFFRNGKFFTPDIPGSQDPPIFAYGGLRPKPALWAVLNGDTLRLTSSKQTDPVRCNPVSFRYLESVGILEYTSSLSCGITFESLTYKLLSRDGSVFHHQDVRPIPTLADFAPYEIGRYWEYLLVQTNQYEPGAAGSPFQSVDSLRWTFQVVDVARPGYDTLLLLRVRLAGRTGIIAPGVSAGVPLDTGYIDSVFIREGALYPVWEENPDWQRARIGLFQKFSPFFGSHQATVWHIPSGGPLPDTVIAGLSRSVFRHKDPVQGLPGAYATGIGLLRGSYSGRTMNRPSSGNSEWGGSITLTGTGTREVGIASRDPCRMEPAVRVPGSQARAGALGQQGWWFGADGRRLNPIR